jgi:hypothetical protein
LSDRAILAPSPALRQFWRDYCGALNDVFVASSLAFGAGGGSA